MAFSATFNLLFQACLLALSYSGRYELTTVCTLLLCAGPIEGCSAVLAVRKYCGFRSWVYKCAQKKKSGFKNKNFVVVSVPRRPYGWRADDTASFDSVSPRRAVVFTSMSWLRLRRAPVSRTCQAHTNTHARASYCCWLGVVLRLVVVLLLLLSSLVISRHS